MTAHATPRLLIELPGPQDSPEAREFHNPMKPAPGKVPVRACVRDARGAILKEWTIYIPIGTGVFDDDGYCLGYGYQRNSLVPLPTDARDEQGASSARTSVRSVQPRRSGSSE